MLSLHISICHYQTRLCKLQSPLKKLKNKKYKNWTRHVLRVTLGTVVVEGYSVERLPAHHTPKEIHLCIKLQ